MNEMRFKWNPKPNAMQLSIFITVLSTQPYQQMESDCLRLIRNVWLDDLVPLVLTMRNMQIMMQISLLALLFTVCSLKQPLVMSRRALIPLTGQWPHDKAAVGSVRPVEGPTKPQIKQEPSICKRPRPPSPL